MQNKTKQLLHIGLLANAAFSLATGLLLAVAPGTVGGWLGVDIDIWLRLLGVVLIGHAVMLGVIARQPQPESLAKLNIAMIAPYPLLMIVLVATGLVDRGVGQTLVLLDGAIVGLIALVQSKGLRSMRQMADPQLA